MRESPPEPEASLPARRPGPLTLARPAAPEPPPPSGRSLIATLRRRLLPFLACAILIPTLAGLALRRVTPRYTATGTLIYEPNAFKPREMQSILRADRITQAVMASQAQVLGGLRLIEPMAERLHLFDDPEFNPALRPQGHLARLIAWLAARLARAPPAAPPIGASPGPGLDPDTRSGAAGGPAGAGGARCRFLARAVRLLHRRRSAVGRGGGEHAHGHLHQGPARREIPRRAQGARLAEARAAALRREVRARIGPHRPVPRASRARARRARRAGNRADQPPHRDPDRGPRRARDRPGPAGRRARRRRRRRDLAPASPRCANSATRWRRSCNRCSPASAPTIRKCWPCGASSPPPPARSARKPAACWPPPAPRWPPRASAWPGWRPISPARGPASTRTPPRRSACRRWSGTPMSRAPCSSPCCERLQEIRQQAAVEVPDAHEVSLALPPAAPSFPRTAAAARRRDRLRRAVRPVRRLSAGADRYHAAGRGGGARRAAPPLLRADPGSGPRARSAGCGWRITSR